ncbi:hypothetical protein HanPI659440_Chr03g0101391 [Helianthus annuus]|nr:hypothetical protein HanPI659440_Chr03g0101391 [Helianthus annuus]
MIWLKASNFRRVGVRCTLKKGKRRLKLRPAILFCFGIILLRETSDCQQRNLFLKFRVTIIFIYLLNPMGMVRIWHFEFLCQSMHIEPMVDRFRVFYQLHCSQGFYSFAQGPTAKKILLVPLKLFHEWKSKFFYIKRGVISVKMNFRGAEDILTETLKTPEIEIWYQDFKDVPSIELPEKPLVAARMSLHWKADCHDKLVYVEDDKIVSLYVVAYKREKGKMSTIQKGADEESWYHQIVKNFMLPKDADMNAQPSAGGVDQLRRRPEI